MHPGSETLIITYAIGLNECGCISIVHDRCEFNESLWASETIGVQTGRGLKFNYLLAQVITINMRRCSSKRFAQSMIDMSAEPDDTVSTVTRFE